MTITFDRNDKNMILQRLAAAGVIADQERVASVLYNIEAAFQQQLGEEADFMINEFEAS